MGSHGEPTEPTDGPDDPQQRRIQPPEGPLLDAWTAPDGGGVKLSIYLTSRHARWLRRAWPRPFGFAPGSAHPAPEHIDEAHGSGTLSNGIASLLGLRTPVHTMSIGYGNPTDPSTPAAKIVSDFRGVYQDRDLEKSLLEAAATWAGDRRASGSRPDITSAIIDVVISDRRRPVSIVRLGQLSAFQVVEEKVLVTVLARHLPLFPDIVRLRLSDWMPRLSAMEHIDADALAAAWAEARRLRTEQMRNPTPPAHDTTDPDDRGSEH
jgi:hypothetical protein